MSEGQPPYPASGLGPYAPPPSGQPPYGSPPAQPPYPPPPGQPPYPPPGQPSYPPPNQPGPYGYGPGYPAYPAQPAGMGPPPRRWRPATPYDEPRPYHLLLRTRGYRWWRPLVALLVFVPTFFVFAVLALVPWLVTELPRILDAAGVDDATTLIDQPTPLFLLANNLALAGAIPATMIGVLAGSRLRPGWLGSVAGRIRWGLLGRSALLALGAVVVFYLLSLLLPGTEEGSTSVELTTGTTFAGFAAVVLLTTPLQAAGEEYFFRGLLFGVIGAWCRRWPVVGPIVGAVVSSLLFALAHGGQNPALFIDRFGFGLVACWLAVRTGGLEASIAMHTVNNVVIFLVAAAFGQVGDSLSVSAAPWSFVLLDIAQMVVFAWLVERLLVRRRRLVVLTPTG